ncbi:MAG: SbcC/MukB-like Walker B domain-containing protein, partial [Bacillota bacterium]|nr:SbcC/MukB-like Walker B domain-containing protein [Bacillota bacterium]
MLERIFNLSEYGEKLNEHIKVKIYEIEKDFENIKGQLSAIEHADDETLKSAQESMEKLEKQKAAELAKFKNIEAEYLKIKDLYETSQNITVFENELKSQQLEKDYFDRLKGKIVLSAKAKEVEPSWQKYKELSTMLIKMRKEIAEISQSLQKIAGVIDQTEKKDEIIRQSAETELPVLYDKKSKLEQGKGLQDKFDIIKKTIEENGAKAEEIKNSMLKVAEQKNKNQIRRTEITAAIHGYDELFKENSPRIARRPLLMEGQKLEYASVTAKAEADRAKQQQEKIKAEKEKIVQEIHEAEENIERSTQLYEKRKSSIEGTINQYKSFKADYVREETALEEELESLLRNEAAYNIAIRLEEDTPCPVCGSTHHPHLAEMKEESAEKIKKLKEEIAHYKKEIEDTDKIILSFTNGYGSEKTADVIVEINNLNVQIASNNTKKEILSEKLKEVKLQYEAAVNSAEGAIKIQFEKSNEFNKFKANNGFGEISRELEELNDIEKSMAENEAERYALHQEYDSLMTSFNGIAEKQGQLEAELSGINAAMREQNNQLKETGEQLQQLVSEGTVYDELDRVNARIDEIDNAKKESAKAVEDIRQKKTDMESRMQMLVVSSENAQKNSEDLQENIRAMLDGTGIKTPDIILQAKLSPEMETNYNIEIKRYEQNITKLETSIAIAREKLKGKTVTATEYDTIAKEYDRMGIKRDEAVAAIEVARTEFERLNESNRKWKIVSENHKELGTRLDSFNQIKKLLAGNKFVEYVAEESLRYVLLEASETLSSLTHRRYRLELGADGEFVVKDYLNGGTYRSVSTLSGGEVFLTSLSLATALSKQIQLKGQSPLEFFFLDEGFGSLDGELLDTVITSLENLASKTRVIGVVSHLKELQERIPRRLYVTRDEYNSSVIKIENS